MWVYGISSGFSLAGRSTPARALPLGYCVHPPCQQHRAFLGRMFASASGYAGVHAISKLSDNVAVTGRLNAVTWPTTPFPAHALPERACGASGGCPERGSLQQGQESLAGAVTLVSSAAALSPGNGHVFGLAHQSGETPQKPINRFLLRTGPKSSRRSGPCAVRTLWGCSPRADGGLTGSRAYLRVPQSQVDRPDRATPGQPVAMLLKSKSRKNRLIGFPGWRARP